MVDVLPFAEAAAVLEDLRVGNLDVTDLACPLLVVDVGDSFDYPNRPVVPPPGLPVVVVGVSRGSVDLPTPAIADVFVVDGTGADPPWVHAREGLTAEVERIETAVKANPDASTTLVQVLRTSESSRTEEALVIESLAYATLQAGPEHRTWLDVTSRPRPDDDIAPAVTLERDGGLLRIWLDRPARRNAYSARMRDELADALTLALADTSVHSVEIRGRGRNFCSGGDLGEFGVVPDAVTAHRIRMARSVGGLIHRLEGRIEVHVQGACVGAGVELPAFAGRVVAVADATFKLPEVQMGLIPGAGGTASIPRRIGPHRTAWLALTGQRIDVGTAHDWGLVDEVAD